MGLRPLLIALLVAAPRIDAQRPATDSVVVRSDEIEASGGSTLDALSPGAQLRIAMAGGRELTGRLLSLDDSSLVMRPEPNWLIGAIVGKHLASRAVSPERFDRAAIRRLEVGESPPWRTEATITGAVLGAAVGAAIRAMTTSECESGEMFCFGSGLTAAVGGLAGLGVGGLIGRDVIGRRRWRAIQP